MHKFNADGIAFFGISVTGTFYVYYIALVIGIIFLICFNSSKGEE